MTDEQPKDMAAITDAEKLAAAITDAEKLARAVMLFFRGGCWSAWDREVWQALTGSDDATTKALCDLARRVQAAEEMVPR